MKLNFILLVLVFGFGSCLNDNISSKSSNNNKIDTVALIVGKWIVEKDSFLIGASWINKMMTDSDYYDFKQDGVLLIKEGVKMDTATYILSAKSNVYISFNGKVHVFTPSENNIPIKGEVIVNRISGNYLIGSFSDSLIRLSITSVINPPEIAEGGSNKLRAEITLKR